METKLNITMESVFLNQPSEIKLIIKDNGDDTSFEAEAKLSTNFSREIILQNQCREIEWNIINLLSNICEEIAKLDKINKGIDNE